jgi:hypothetical protein
MDCCQSFLGYGEPLWLLSLDCLASLLVGFKLGFFKLVSVYDAFLHWLGDSQNQTTVPFLATAVVSFVWYGISMVCSCRARSSARQTTHLATSEQTSLETPQPNVLITTPSVDTPDMHRPTAAYGRLVAINSRTSPNNNAYDLDERTGRVSSPEYQTPFVANSIMHNFSGLAKTAPISYDTLIRNGILNSDGTPTKKYSPDTLKHKELSPSLGEVLSSSSTPTKCRSHSKHTLR